MDTPDTPDYIGEIVADMRQAITNHQSDWNMVMMAPQISCYSHWNKLFQRGQEVDNPLVSLV